MRILHIVGTISPAAGGPTEVVRMLVRYAPPGDSAELATLDDPDSPFLNGLGFPVHALGSAKKSWYSPKLVPWLRQNRHRFDGVIVHGLWEFTGLAVSLAHAKTPYVVFPHGMLDPWFKHRYPRKHAKKWLYWLLAEYWVLRRATRVLFTTETERELAAQSFWLHRWKPLVVALGTEPPPADTARLLAAFHALVPEVAGCRFLLFLGRIDPKKGPDLLLEAFLSVAESAPELHLVMAGPGTSATKPGDFADQLRARADASAYAERIHWPGMLLGDAKWGAIAACEAFVLPSHQENFGIAVVEALASGRPVLISDQVNIAPQIAAESTADRCGLVAPDTQEGTLKLLQDWLQTTEDERTAMSQCATNTFATHYDMRRNTAAILRVFNGYGKPRKEAR
jgi:glycosyltransferase involved in cell wall biosynthesis